MAANQGFSTSADGYRSGGETGWNGLGGRVFSAEEEGEIKDRLRGDTPYEDSIPTADAVSKAGAIKVADKNGKEILFSDLYAQSSVPDNRRTEDPVTENPQSGSSDGEKAGFQPNEEPALPRYEPDKQRKLFIFIRNFLCPLDREYVQELSSTIPPSSLPAGTTIILIGCGHSEMIPTYLAETKCPYEIYTDKTHTIYNAFLMYLSQNLSDKRPDKIGKRFIARLSAGSQAFKAGPDNQLGGEMLFEDGRVVWCHRMLKRTSHTRVGALKMLLRAS